MYIIDIENKVTHGLNELSEINEIILNGYEEHKKEMFEIEMYEGISTSEERFNLTNVYPRIICETLYISSYSFLESTLMKICNEIDWKLKPKIRLNHIDRKHKGVFRAKEYLIALGVQFPETTQLWENIEIYNLVRNSLVHSNGKLEKGSFKKNLIDAFISKHKNIQINQYNRVYITRNFINSFTLHMSIFYHVLFENMDEKLYFDLL